MTNEKTAIARLKALGKQKAYRPLFEYLRARELPSRSTDIYSIKEGEFSPAIAKKLFEELARVGIGRFLNRRSYSWENFDLRAIGQLALAPGGESLRFKQLYRQDYLAEVEALEKKLIWESLSKQTVPRSETPGSTSPNKLKQSRKATKNQTQAQLAKFTKDELIAALEAKGLEIFVRDKSPAR